MATWLNEYTTMKNEMAKQVSDGQMPVEGLMCYQELLYRIEVLEACQTFCKTAPVTMELPALINHYQLVDAYIQCLTSERRFGQPADKDAKTRRETASGALEKTVVDCRKRFSSFSPSSQDQYKKSIGSMVSTILPVWLQLRNAYINITK